MQLSTDDVIFRLTQADWPMRRDPTGNTLRHHKVDCSEDGTGRARGGMASDHYPIRDRSTPRRCGVPLLRMAEQGVSQVPGGRLVRLEVPCRRLAYLAGQLSRGMLTCWRSASSSSASLSN